MSMPVSDATRRADAADASAPAPRFVLSVRALCELVARRGDLEAGGPGPDALQGQAGHALVAARRGAGWQAERPLALEHAGPGGVLRVRGRADGWHAASGRLEEVKTHRGRPSAPGSSQRALHWAQAEVYGAMACAEDGLAHIELALVELDIDSGHETVELRRLDAAELRARVAAWCAAALAWLAAEAAHRAARDAALAGLAFVHEAFRPGQRELAAQVYKGVCSGRVLLAQAPTGIGKTLGTIYPVLRAMPGRLDRLVFLTARTSGRALALDALERLVEPAPDAPRKPLRVLELVARDKACEHPGRACHGASCPLAAGHFDRLGAAREAALALPHWRRDSLRAHAAAHGLCPYHLGLELARWADAVVGDYNHWFDPGSALLHGLAQQQGWRVALLVDEAHNLVDRARAMHSAALDGATLAAARRAAPPGHPLRPALDRLQRRWRALLAAHPGDDVPLDAPPQALGEALQAYVEAWVEQLIVDGPPLPGGPRGGVDGDADGGADVLADAPRLFDADPEAEGAAADTPRAALRELAFEAGAWLRLAEAHGPHDLIDLQRTPGGGARLALRNVVPAPFLAPRWAAAQGGATLFSATLPPTDHLQRLLGLPGEVGQVARLEVGSPFRAEQLQVRVARGLSTRWAHRARSLPRLVELLAQAHAERPGHYLVFFSSFDYLAQAEAALAAAHPGLPLRAQRRGMSEAEQAAFLADFQPGGSGLALAVLGGAFAEGIDLPGERLIGAGIATLGLPPPEPVRERMRERLDALFGAGVGHDDLYVVPGLQKVVQAAGRVIRTPEDRGLLLLLDERYARPEVQARLPPWWHIEAVGPPPRRPRPARVEAP